jgi:hypothetical protein
MQETNFSKPEGTRIAGRPYLRRLDRVEEGLRMLGVRGWKAKSLGRNLWRRLRPRQGCSASRQKLLFY